MEDLLTLGPRAQATLVDMKTSKNKNDSQVTSCVTKSNCLTNRHLSLKIILNKNIFALCV